MPAQLLETGQISCYAIGDDGDYELGVDKAYTVNALAGTSDIEVAHLADSTLSFTAPNTIASAGNLLVGWAVNDRMLIKGSASNDGEVLVTGVGGAPANLTISAAVNEIAGRVISLYKVAALSNNIVHDDRTGLDWARYTSNGLGVGAASTGLLNWYDVATRFTLYNVANTISVIMPGNIFRITGGAALTQFHVGDCIMAAGFANGVNNLPMYRILSVTVNGADLDIEVQPQQNDPMVAEGAVGDTLYLNTRSIYNYAAGANLAGLGGYTDWREPCDNELVNLRNMAAPAANAVPDAAAFPGWPAAAVWSSTTDATTGLQGLNVAFWRGTTSRRLKTSAFVTVLVRP